MKKYGITGNVGDGVIDIDTIACSIGWIEIISVGLAVAVVAVSFMVLLVWFIWLELKG